MILKEKTEKIWELIQIIENVDDAEDHQEANEKDYENESKAQEQLWKILETLSFNEIQKLADDLYTRKFTLIGLGRKNGLHILCTRGTEQAFLINNLSRRLFELESNR
ncbi:hypothetical protein N9483_00020 [Flavobacteriaceae bacterium]|nr:hypothetical protein [Flavobacteriaceae bacterium]